jgi:glycosyltransferase involved in cell wall biosynthesis
MFFSIIIPVFNRPDEIRELLESISSQTFRDFEVLVIEDGSNLRAEEVCKEFSDQLSIRYSFQKNAGQGFARNYGMKQAQGEFFVILDSDVLLPEQYLQVLFKAIRNRKLDAFGGPDAADSNFSALQKAMDYAMTSFWTTGGIRGKLKNPSSYQARGFNMGVSKSVFEKTGGFIDPNRGEDIEWSIRIKKAGFKLQLVEDAFVFHKRKNTLLSFAKQGFSFGQNRVNVSRFHPEAIKLVHLLPSVFLLFLISIPVIGLFSLEVFYLQLLLLGFWSVLIVIGSFLTYRSAVVSLLSLLTSVVQLSSYGAGLIGEWIRKVFKG